MRLIIDFEGCHFRTRSGPLQVFHVDETVAFADWINDGVNQPGFCVSFMGKQAQRWESKCDSGRRHGLEWACQARRHVHQ
jgi:hypothetical protein